MFRRLSVRSSSAARGEYHPLPQNDARNETQNSMENAERSQDARAENYRDAAAMLLIKMGRSPDEQIAITPADDARILRRIDLALLPLMLSVYFLQALDKATLSYASIFGLIEDTKLEGDQYSWLGSIVFLAQLIMQPPLALALVKLPIGKLTSAMVLAWGTTLILMTWAKEFKTLMVARFFLGAFEASIGPSFIAITQMWWRRRYGRHLINRIMSNISKRADAKNRILVLYEWVDMGGKYTCLVFVGDQANVIYSLVVLLHMDLPASSPR